MEGRLQATVLRRHALHGAVSRPSLLSQPPSHLVEVAHPAARPSQTVQQRGAPLPFVQLRRQAARPPVHRTVQGRAAAGHHRCRLARPALAAAGPAAACRRRWPPGLSPFKRRRCPYAGWLAPASPTRGPWAWRASP